MGPEWAAQHAKWVSATAANWGVRTTCPIVRPGAAAARAAAYVVGAELGAHGVDFSFAPVLDLDFGASAVIGDRALLEELRRLSIAIYERGAELARAHGIILAHTQFEFGRRADGTIVLGDEVLTMDSSRFWPADGYTPGRSQPSFDKQTVRDWATSTGWDKTPPAPPIPAPSAPPKT